MQGSGNISRRRFIKLSGAAAALSALVPVSIHAAETNRHYASTACPDRIILSWMNDPSTTQAVTWRTDTSVTHALAQIAQSDGSPYFAANSSQHIPSTKTLNGPGWSDLYHTVNFSGLTPDTVYNYRLGDGSVWTEWHQFQTASLKADPFSFIYLGDAQTSISSMWSHVVRRARTKLPDARFIIHAGDLINNDGSDEEWGEWHAADGWVQSGINCIATPGNHEYDDLDITPQWKVQFAFPKNGPEHAELENTVYYIDYQGVRIISLDTTAMSSPRLLLAQRTWCENVLKDNPSRWTIVTHHYPMFAGAENRTGDFLLNLFFRKLYDKYKVDLVLQGHDHTYARGVSPNIFRWPGKDPGPVYIVSVSGPKMYESKALWADVKAENLQLYQHISITGSDLSFKAYTSSGGILDSFKIEKDENGSRRIVN